MTVFPSVPLTDVLEFREGPGILAKDFRESGVPLLRLAGLKSGAALTNGCNYLDPAMVASKWSQFKVRLGDTLLSTSASLGEVAVVGEDAVGAVPYTGIIAFRPRDDRYVPDFIRFALVEKSFKDQIAAMGVGSVMQHFGPSHLRQMSISLPPVCEQRAIAEVLGALDDKIAANDRAAGLAEELLRAKFDQMGLVDELGDGGAKLSDLVELQPRRVATGEVPFIDMQAIPTRGWTLPAPSYREARGGARFTNGDTLLARITPCLENRKTAYVNDLPDRVVGAGSTEFIVMRSRDPHPLPLSFFVATDETFRSYAIQHMVGTSGRQRVSAVDLAHFPISMPAPEALREWGRLADPMFARVRSMGRENRILATLRDALLPELMSGRLRVKDAETTVEEVV